MRLQLLLRQGNFGAMIRYIILAIMLLVFCLMPYALLQASGLSTGFSEVTLENLEAGRIYSIKDAAGLPLIIVNTGREPVDLKIELLLPDRSELNEGYASIPDLGWIKLARTEFRGIKPNDSAITDVIILIPDDKQYVDKKYQVFIWSHTVGKSIGLGLKSKLLFSILSKAENE